MAALQQRAAALCRTVGVRCASIDATAVRYAKAGFPTSVLKVEKIKIDTSSLKATDVLVKMVAAPITPVDLAAIKGVGRGASAASAASYPRVGGTEGVGIVEEAGSSSGLKKGDMVAVSRPGVGTWSTHVVAPGDSFTKVTAGGKGPIEAVAACVVPILTAHRLLAMGGGPGLSKGDVVVQNGADSTVGQAVVQIASSRGIKTLNILRARGGGSGSGGWADMVAHLQALGATAVVSDAQAARHEFASKVLADMPAGKLGLNSAGGAAAAAVARALAPGSTLVTFGSSGGARAAAVSAPLDWFTARDLTLRGFNLGASLAATPGGKAAVDESVRAAVESVSSGGVRLLVAREPFADFGAALARAMRPDADRKVVLTF